MAEARKSRYGVSEETKAGTNLIPMSAPKVHEGVTFEGVEMKEWKEGEPSIIQFTFSKVDAYGEKETLMQSYWPINEDKEEEIARKAWNSMEAKGSFYKGCPDNVEDFIEDRITQRFENWNSSIKHILTKVLDSEDKAVIKPKGKNDQEVYQNMGSDILSLIQKSGVSDRTYNLKVIKDYRGYSALPERPNFIEIHVDGKPSRLTITDREAKVGNAGNAKPSAERDAQSKEQTAADTSF
jgi:hypothetical protein